MAKAGTKGNKAPAVRTHPKSQYDPFAAFRALAQVVQDEHYEKTRHNAIVDASTLDLDFKYLYVQDLGHQWGLGRPGYVLGRIKLVAGMEGASKSSTLYDDCGNCIRQGGIASIVALEEADSTRHIANYVDPSRLIMWKARTLEEGMEMSLRIQKLFKEIDENSPDPSNPIPKVQGFDSIAGATEAALAIDFDSDDDDVEDQAHSRVGGVAKTMKSFFNTMKSAIVETNTLWDVLNQAREQIYTGMEAQFMMRKALRDRLALTGGKAQRFAATYLEFHCKGKTAKEAGETEDDAKVSIGFDVTVDWIKNKTGTPDRKITRRVVYGRGFDYVGFTIPMLAGSRICGMGVHKKRYWCDEVGIDEGSKVEAQEMYDLIHQPEHIWKFQRALDIQGVAYPVEAQAAAPEADQIPGPSAPSPDVSE